MPAFPLNGQFLARRNAHISRAPLQQTVHVNDAVRKKINKSQVQTWTCRAGNHGCKVIQQCHLLLLYQRQWPWSMLQPVRVQPDGARRDAQWNFKSLSWNNKRHTFWSHVIPAGSALTGNKTQAGASQTIRQCVAQLQESTQHCCQRSKATKTGKRRVRDNPRRSVNPACVWSPTAQASKGVRKTPWWVQNPV